MTDSKVTFDSYIEDAATPVREILEHLRALVHQSVPQATEVMKWGAPVFRTEDDGEFAYLNAGKDHANLGFNHGADLNDPNKLLEGKGKAGRHVKFFPDRPVADDEIIKLLKQYA